MIVFDERQLERLDEMEVEILNYAASLPPNQAMDDLKEELEHFGFTLGSA
ncbi:MAG TPA: hypothetical protein VEG08_00580 [Terriglobales bacterium]|nr:hypothetical protein [Terriglobales bacterium]